MFLEDLRSGSTSGEVEVLSSRPLSHVPVHLDGVEVRPQGGCSILSLGWFSVGSYLRYLSDWKS